jgi:hypothetical protein
MAITPPVQFVQTTNFTQGTAQTVSSAVPAGALIVIAVYDWDATPAQMVITATDSAGNKYLPTAQPQGGSTEYSPIMLYCQNCLAIPGGGTVTVSGSSVTQITICGVWSNGANGGLDKQVTGVNSSAQGISLTAGGWALSSANEISFTIVEVTGSFTVFTEGAGYATLGNFGGSGGGAHFAYAVSSSNVQTQFNYNPSWTGTASATSGALASFMATGDNFATAGQSLIVM